MSLFEPEKRPPVKLHRRALADVSMLPLVEEIPLDRAVAHMYGKAVRVPRAECWFGSVPYTYGGQKRPPRKMGPLLLRVKARVEEASEEVFDSCFANYYASGDDCIAWHADDESWIGPVIASLSLGATRRFCMRAKAGGGQRARAEWLLDHGDLLVMLPGCQEAWEHRVPRERTARPRLNLTFRQTVAEEQHRG